MFRYKLSGALMAGTTAGAMAFALTHAEAGGTTGAVEFGPDKGMSFIVGSKKLVTYYDKANGSCELTIMVAEDEAYSGSRYNSAARLYVSLEPGKSTRFDSIEGKSLKFICNEDAASISVRKEHFKTSSRAKS